MSLFERYPFLAYLDHDRELVTWRPRNIARGSVKTRSCLKKEQTEPEPAPTAPAAPTNAEARAARAASRSVTHFQVLTGGVRVGARVFRSSFMLRDEDVKCHIGPKLTSVQILSRGLVFLLSAGNYQLHPSGKLFEEIEEEEDEEEEATMRDKDLIDSDDWTTEKENGLDKTNRGNEKRSCRRIVKQEVEPSNALHRLRLCERPHPPTVEEYMVVP